MPLIRIDAWSAHPAADLVAVGDSVHRAMVETLGAPAESKFQVLTGEPLNVQERARQILAARAAKGR